MSFKYINPGFNTGVLKTMTQYTDNDSKYSGGVYLKGDGLFYLPGGVKSLYLSFVAQNVHSCTVCAYDGSDGKETGFYCDGANNIARLNKTNAKSMLRGDVDLIVSWYVKIISDSANGEFVLMQDGVAVYEYTGNVMNGADISRIKFSCSLNNHRTIANLIISDEYFPPSEKIIALPVANTTATMADNGDGSYTADEVGETVMQTIDAAKLTQAIGEGNTLTGFSLIGNPAYYDGTELTHLGAMKGETVKESVALPTNTDGKILASWSDNVKQADIANLSLGWKAQV